jgi:hypothetical protein
MKICFETKLGLCLAIFAINMLSYSEAQSIQERIKADQAEGSVPKLTALADEIEVLWTNEVVLYFQSYDQLGTALETLATTNSDAMHELLKQTERVLDRKCPTNPAVAASCFSSKLSIAEQLMRNLTKPNIQDIQCLAKFLGEVRTAIITNYQWAKVEMNVMPPIAPTNSRMGVISGMDPKAISDPVARAAYEKAIDENNQRGAENDLQQNTLPEINRTMTPLFLDYVKIAFRQNPKTKKSSASLTEMAHLSNVERQQLQ